MKLTAVFESWHIDDGNYPPLKCGQLVNLSFELEPKFTEEVDGNGQDGFEHLGNAEYKFRGSVIKVYPDRHDVVVVVRTGEFCFYIMSRELARFEEGMRISGEGTLLLDHYSWVEFLSKSADAPNLFYNLKVTRIRKVNIPERFVNRHEKGKSFPTRITPQEYSETQELESMEGQEFDEEFYIVDFDGSGLEHENFARTFR